MIDAEGSGLLKSTNRSVETSTPNVKHSITKLEDRQAKAALTALYPFSYRWEASCRCWGLLWLKRDRGDEEVKHGGVKEERVSNAAGMMGWEKEEGRGGMVVKEDKIR